MAEVNLLRALPKTKRNARARAAVKTAEHVRIAREYGELYFDGPREYGYGGYRYDGRWIPVAQDIVAHFGLRPGDRVLDVGCGKGFLVKDLMRACPGVDAFGLDVSFYGLAHAEPEAAGRLVRGSADRLPFPDRSFAAVLSLNTIHNLPRGRAVAAVREVERLAPGKGFVQVDSYRTEAERELFLGWVLTAEFHDTPAGWLRLFAEAGYTGDWYWTIVG